MDTITSYFAQQGILGIIILMTIGIIVWQQKRIDNKDKQITDLQDKRLVDSNSYSQNYIQIAKEVVGTTRDSVNASSLLQKSVDGLTGSIQTLLGKK